MGPCPCWGAARGGRGQADGLSACESAEPEMADGPAGGRCMTSLLRQPVSSGERPAGKPDGEPGVQCRTNREMSYGLRPPALWQASQKHWL